MVGPEDAQPGICRDGVRLCPCAPQETCGLPAKLASTETKEAMTTTSTPATQSYVLVPAVEVELPLADLEDAQLALGRIEHELVTVDASQFAPMNTDVVVAASTVLGHIQRILEHRDAIVDLKGFEARNVDNLSDYAKATWITYVGNQPASSSKEEANVAAEVARLRAKFLVWATAHGADGVFDSAAIAKIRDGSGYRDAAGDLVALVLLFREHEEEVKDKTGITAEDLARGAQLGAAAFAMLSRRENPLAPAQADDALRARRAWTLLDRAYGQVRRALDYLRYEQGDADLIAPNLRRNRSASKAAPADEPATDTVVAPAVPAGGR
jgi:hypothetical protein